tara:strand:+ start:1521 stop:2249 length:729 start_codon:yes stop_codon:yes gene_type:complete
MIIAEIGKNHLGKPEFAREYVQSLLLTAIDGISFQIREKSHYLKPEKKKFILDKSNYTELANKIKKTKKFGMALADPSFIEFFEELGTDFYKVIRNDINNDELVSKLIKTGKTVFISTGMCSERDILNFKQKYGTPTNVILNHTQLSNLVSDCNLKAIESLKKYGFKVSYGNHCDNLNVIYLSLFYKPSDIMFYVKACEKIDYPDNKHAVLLEKVSKFTKNLISLKEAEGSGIKETMKNKIK